jgi:hypothetical protein
MAHTLSIGATILLAMTGTARADDVLVGRPDGLGVGLVLGSPTGISLAKRERDELWQAAIGWNVVRDAMHLTVDRLFVVSEIKTDETPNVDWPLYLGAGISLRVGGDLGGRFDSGNADANLGIRLPAGVTMLPRDTRIDAFLELVPVVSIYPATDFDLDAGLGLRFYL